MKRVLYGHLAGMLFVSAVLLVLLFSFNGSQPKSAEDSSADFAVPGIELTDPFQKSLLYDAANLFHPGEAARIDSLISLLIKSREAQVRRNLESQSEEHLSWDRLVQIFGMYFKFLFVFITVLGLTYYGVQTLGLFLFVYRKKRPVQRSRAKRILKVIGSSLLYFILFSPSYVIAYSIRTEFGTDSLPFMILLGLVSNGLLVTYANKFYHLLLSESRKGYVETARVKGLQDDFSLITSSQLIKLRKQFQGHILEPIFRNARYQYLLTIKEQAAFLVTGLVIVEMALNIHGFFCYEMLRQMLYRNYDVVIVFFLGIYYTVKLTEMAADFLYHRESRRYENA